jgi:hypothetical protein
MEIDGEDERLFGGGDVCSASGVESSGGAATSGHTIQSKMFKIEAVGLTSFWFSFGSSSLAHFAVEWESEKEGCRMHVSPYQLWPHTKVYSLRLGLICVRIHALGQHALSLHLICKMYSW